MAWQDEYYYTGVYIKKKHKEYLDKKSMNLSKFVRSKIDDEIKKDNKKRGR